MGRPFILYSDDEGSEESCTPECHLGLSFKAFHDLCMPALTEAEPELEDEPEDEVQAILRWLFSLCQTAYVPQVQWSGMLINHLLPTCHPSMALHGMMSGRCSAGPLCCGTNLRFTCSYCRWFKHFRARLTRTSPWPLIRHVFNMLAKSSPQSSA